MRATAVHVAICSIIAGAAAAAAAHTRQPPRGWAAVGAAELLLLPAEAAEDKPLPIALALTLSPRAVRELEQSFEQVSDPRHARYGQHLSAAGLEASCTPIY